MLLLFFGHAEQCARMPFSDLASADRLLHIFIQLQQPNLVGNRALALADFQRQL